MNLKHLRYFVATVDEGGVRRASERIHVSQPAMSLAIKKLEADLGVSLFEREGRGAAPTREGYRLYREARDLLAKAQKVSALFKDRKEGGRIELRIGAPAMILSYGLADLLTDFLVARPAIGVNAMQMGGAAVESGLLHGQIDAGFLGRPPKSAELSFRPVLTAKLRLFLRKGHPLLQQDEISWPQVFSFPIAAPPASYVLQDWLKEISSRHKCALEFGVTSDSLRLITAALRRTDMTALLIENFANEAPDLIALPLDRIDATADPYVKINFCHRKEKSLPEGLSALADFFPPAER